jgi:hypothetical protein
MSTQLIRMVDQHGKAVPLSIWQDGQPASLVLPGKRTRFKIRAGVLAYRVNRIVLPECPENWHVYDISIGGLSMFVARGDSPEEDGVPGEVFAAGVIACFVRFTTCQNSMDLVLDVTYHGPVEGGAPFCCNMECTAAYAGEVPVYANKVPATYANYANEVPENPDSSLVGKWKDPNRRE